MVRVAQIPGGSSTYIIGIHSPSEVTTPLLRCVCVVIGAIPESRRPDIGNLFGLTGQLFTHTMYFRVKLVLILSLFTSWSSCLTKFVQPPERDTDERTDQDMSKNKRYADGDTIPIIWDTNIEDVDLYVWQVIGAGRNTKSLMKSRRALFLFLIVLLINAPRLWSIE